MTYARLLANMLQLMPVEVKFLDPELAERYSDSERTTVRKQQKFFLHGDTTMEVKVVGKKATIILDSGFALSATAPEIPILKNVYGSNLSVEAGDEDHALQMQIDFQKGFNANVIFNNRVIANLHFT